MVTTWHSRARVALWVTSSFARSRAKRDQGLRHRRCTSTGRRSAPMVCSIYRPACACIGLLTILAWPTVSLAEDGAPATAPRGITVTRTLEPNGAIVVELWPDTAPAESPPPAIGTAGTLLLSGAVTFGFSYVPAVMTASESTFAIDKQLYVPVVGPWLDLANRPNCGA